ncbi:hypothetical protein QU42_31515 [Bradyrhizobium sp. UASWS1016]|nr:hypothetical protein CWS35_21110 [Bradyrhizobium sp. SK17]OCX27234.1 hypothetical protein QU42_31515 [Bradyrhizobium sp. UASWS1016]
MSGSWPVLLVQCFWPPVFGDGIFRCEPERAATDGCEVVSQPIGADVMPHPTKLHGIVDDTSS